MIDTIKDIIAGQLHIETAAISGDSDIFDDLGADSLDVVEMLMSVELTFGIIVPDDEIVNLRTLNDIKQYIDSNHDPDHNADNRYAEEKKEIGELC